MSNAKTESMIYPLRIKAEMAQAIRALSRDAGLSGASIMRLAIARGLPRVRRMLLPRRRMT